MSSENTRPEDPFLSRLPQMDGSPTLGGVSLEAKLGQGGMGAVYSGRHSRLGIRVAVKLMAPPEGAGLEQAVQRFVREARTAASIRHPNLVRVYDINSESGVHYLVMDLVQGESSGARLKRMGSLGGCEAARIALAAAEGLAAAHAAGVVHRDVKPDNILLDSRGGVFVADLGLAKAFSGDAEVSTTELSLSMQVLGTPCYMAPEQTRSAKGVGPEADVWSLGVTLLQLATGRLPWPHSDLSDLIQSIRRDPLPLDLMKALPQGLETIVERALQKEPAARYRDCGEMARALSAWIARTPSPLEGSKELSGQTLSLMDERDLASPRAATRRRASRAQAGILLGSMAAAMALGRFFPGPLLILPLASGVLSALAGTSAWLVFATGMLAGVAGIMALPYLGVIEAILGSAATVPLCGPGLLVLWLRTRRLGTGGRMLAPVAVALTVILLLGTAVFTAMVVSSRTVHVVDPAQDHYLMGLDLEDSGDYAGAIREYSRAIELNPSHMDSLRNRASLHGRRQEYDLAIADMDRLIEMAPADSALRYGMGSLRENAGDLDGAIAAYSEAIRLHRDYGPFYRVRADALMKKGEPARAAADYSRAADYSSSDHRPYMIFERALANEVAGNLHAADADLRELARSSEGMARHLCMRIDGFEPSRRLSALDMVLEAWPELVPARIMRADTRLKLGDIDGAAGDCSRVLEIEPDHRGALTQRAEAHNKAGRHEEAVADLKMAIELTPDNPSLRQYFQALLGQSLYLLARASFDSGDYTRAADICSETLEANPSDAYTLRLRAEARAALGDFREALEDMDAAIDLNPNADDGTFYMERADIREASGDAAGAEADRTKAHSIGEWR